MGDHVFSFPPAAGDDFDCNDIVPYQLLYWNGKLNGFVFQHSAMLESSRYEHPDPDILGLFAIEPPQCAVDLAANPGASTMHVWVSDYILACE